MAASQLDLNILSGYYRVYFLRAPDAPGFDSWKAQLDAGVDTDGNPITIEDISNGFYDNAYAQNLYASLDNEAYVQAIYANALNGTGGQQPSRAEINGWVAELDAGLSRADMVSQFLTAALTINFNQPPLEGYTQAQWDAGAQRQAALKNSIEVGNTYMDQLGDATAVTEPDPTKYDDDPAFQSAQKIISGVTFDSRTAASAESFINSVAGSSDPVQAVNDATTNEIFGFDGELFVLTTGQDVFVPTDSSFADIATQYSTTGDDTVRGVAGVQEGAQDQTTLNSSDILDAGAGDDLLVMNMTGPIYSGGARIESFETLQIGSNFPVVNFDYNVNRGQFEIDGTNTIVADQITAGETLTVANVTPTANGGVAPALHWSNEAGSVAGTVALTYRQASTATGSDNQSVNLENVGGGTLDIGSGMESLTLESSGSVSQNTLRNSNNPDTGDNGVYNTPADLISNGSLQTVILENEGDNDTGIGKAAGVIVSDTAVTHGLTDRAISQVWNSANNQFVGIPSIRDTGITTESSAAELLSVGARVTEVDASGMNGDTAVRFVPRTDNVGVNVTFKGGNGADYVEFNLGDATATGGAGDDTFAFVVPVGVLSNSGFSSADNLQGGEGNDTVLIGMNGAGRYNLNTTEFNNKTGIDTLDLRGTTNNVTISDAFAAGADTGALTVRTDKIVQTSATNSADPRELSSLKEFQSASTIDLTRLQDNRAIEVIGGSGQERMVGNNASINASTSIDGGNGMDSITVLDTAVLDANDLGNIKNVEMLNLVTTVTGNSSFDITITEDFLANNTRMGKTFVIASEQAAGGLELNAGDTVRIDVSDLFVDRNSMTIKNTVLDAGYQLNIQDIVDSGATVQLIKDGDVLAIVPEFVNNQDDPNSIIFADPDGGQADDVILDVLPGGAGTGDTELPFIPAAPVFVINESSLDGSEVGTVNAPGADAYTIIENGLDLNNNGELPYVLDGATGRITINDTGDLVDGNANDGREIRVQATDGVAIGNADVTVNIEPAAGPGPGPGNVIQVPIGVSETIQAQAGVAEVFAIDLVTAFATDDNTQASIAGFDINEDSLRWDAPDSVAPQNNTLDQFGGLDLGNGNVVAVQPNIITNQTDINFGLDASGDAVTLSLLAITDPAAVDVAVI